MKQENKRRNEKIMLAVMIVISVAVIVTGTLFAFGSLRNGKIAGAVLGVIIALIILAFAVIVLRRGKRDLKEGYPLKDERSRKVMEKASSLSFYVSLYWLLLIGFLSEWIPFRDVSQATSVGVGGMALLFLIFWLLTEQINPAKSQVSTI